MAPADASSARSWRRDSAAPAAALLTRSGLAIDVFKLSASACPAASGARILFLSDLHVRSEATWSWTPFRGGLISWQGLDWISGALQEAVAMTSPSHIVFGGDLVVHSCWLERASSMLGALAPGIPKLAVLGNWDKRRRRWLAHRVWAEAFAKAGFSLLVNEPASAGAFRFYGLDDFKMGHPFYRRPRADEKTLFNCVISHNPDSVMRSLSDADLDGVDLILCGHTHGGQVRLPLLGALDTSSKHWKCLEKGLYRHSSAKAKLLVCSGIGATAISVRFNCPPEVLLVEIA